jgi:hypothetical protein
MRALRTDSSFRHRFLSAAVCVIVSQASVIAPRYSSAQSFLVDQIHERTPYRQIGSDSWVKFILASANMYTISSQPADYGSAIVPLYTDYNAGGTYGTPDYINVTINGDNPDAADGTSSYAMTWDGTGGSGHFQFDIGCTVSNRPRDAVNFGLARQVRFYAKGDFPSRQLQVYLFKRSPCNFTQFVTQSFTLNTSWQSYSLDISSFGLRPQDLHAVQFVISVQGGTVLFDDVRIDTDAYDPLAGIQSYIAHWAAQDSPPDTPAWRDANLYPNRSYLYDNALAIEALLAGGYPSAAMNIADARIATAMDCSNGFPNELNSGHTLLSDGTSRAPFNHRKRLGDNAWFGLALLDLFYSTNQTKYLDCARQISDWAEANLKASGQYEGYFGGYDDNGQNLDSRSTEENADHFQLNSQLGGLLGQPYTDRATWAGNFVIAMFDKGKGRFWAGTSSGDVINMASIPLDAQTLPFLTLGLSAQYHDAVNYLSAISWAEKNLIVTNNSFTGFTYSSVSKMQQNPRVWFEGTAQVCLAYEILGQLEPASLTPWGAKAMTCLQTLQNASPDATGILAASDDDLQDTVLNQFYDARQAVAPTAWAVFVRSMQGIR